MILLDNALCDSMLYHTNNFASENTANDSMLYQK